MNINAPVNIAEIRSSIYDAFERGYDDKQQVYEDLEDQYFEDLQRTTRSLWKFQKVP